MLTPKEIAALTPEQKAELKAKHGALHLYKIEEYVALLRKPTRNDLSYASAGAKGEAFKLTELLLNQCWLGGDEILRDNLDYYLGLSEKFNELVAVKQGELGEL